MIFTGTSTIAVIRNSCAITEIADIDTPFVNTKQLIEVQVAWIIELKERSTARLDWANAMGAQSNGCHHHH